jgi:colicin import membrane protein
LTGRGGKLKRMYLHQVYTPMEPLFRRMIAFSLVFHFAAFGIGLLWAALHAPPPRFLEVAVVDLVGGEAFAPPPRETAKVDEQPAPPPPAPETPAKEKKAPKEPAAPPPVTAKAEKKSTPKEVPDEKALAESIRKMRQKRASTEKVGEAVGTIRREKAARSAIRQIGERASRKIDLSAARPASGGMAGAAGSARVPPEHLAYFRQLDEKIRSNWTVPALAVGEKEALMVQLRIVIEKDGRVSQVRMEKTSGNPYFDDSVRRAINKASPLPVPPEQLRGGEDYYEIGFRFYEDGGAS